MLGLADRQAVFDLMDAVMGGKPASALAITDRAYERGADLGTLLQDLLDLLHTITRLKSVPGLRQSQELPEAERTRGAELADRLTVPTLSRAWQMLLKGVGEVETAPDRRAAAEMVLIRLCHIADMPTPADLIRRLASATPVDGSAPPASIAPAPSPSSGGGRCRTCGRQRLAPYFDGISATSRTSAKLIPRRRRIRGRPEGGDVARASSALRSSCTVRTSGDRVASRVGSAA